MEDFLERLVQKIRKESPRRFRDLRNCCDGFLQDVHNENGEAKRVTLEPLVLACETRNPRLMEIALDGFHHLIEHGYLTSLKAEKSLADSEVDALNTTIIETVCKCSEEFDDAVQLQVVKALLVAVTSLQFEMHEANLLLAVRACFQIHLTSKNPVIKTTAKAALTQMISLVYQRMESYDVKPAVEGESSPTPPESAVRPADGNSTSPGQDTFESVHQKDAYLLFRALCRLSTKGTSDDAVASSDAVIHQNKLLSLELILVLLRNSGPLFRKSTRFINAIKTFLCNSLLSNCTSTSPQVAGLALQIFVLLVQEFKEHLKGEVEVFISSIFLRIVESEYSTYDHKARVLEVLHLIFADARAQLELFANYDCDLNATNLFSRIVASLAKLAKNSSSLSGNKLAVEFMTSTAKKQQQDDAHLRFLGLEGLIIMLRSLKFLCFRQDEDQTRVDPESRTTLSSPSAAELEPLATDILPADPASVDDASGQIGIDMFDKKLKLERDLENGILKFNLSPMKGLKYLSSKGILRLEAFDIAHFITEYNDRIDKTAVGDLLGREREYENGLCYEILHEYVKLMDFSDMDFVSAIRMFLSGFRLPGEAQKIDRIMEKFAEKYYLQHKEDFANADMAFILAFSTIMLQTNLHNPAIRDDKRMTKDQFIKQNKGISSDGELSDELLSEVFDRIAAEPISLQSETTRKLKKDESGFVVFSSSVDRKKKDAFNTERKEMMRQSEALMRQKKSRTSVFVKNLSSQDDTYQKSMYEVIWPPVLGAISFTLDLEDDPKLCELCLHAFDLCITLACKLDFPVARNTFVNALSKFTSLDTVREMKSKQIACIRLLLHIAVNWGDSLEESWNPVLLSISHLARLQMFAHGSQNDDPFARDVSSNGNHRRQSRAVSDRPGSSSTYSDPVTKFFLGVTKAESNRLIEETNAEFLSQNIDPELIDRVFVISTKLSSTSVDYFVKSLCVVSLQEISVMPLKSKEAVDFESPRIFCLQKLVEVADYNMSSRSRVEWANIWSILAKHFSNVGLHENLAVAMYAIDSLKQLSIKFLQKEELSNFNFQRMFLRPFETILSRTSAVEIKDLILRCIDIMIRACAHNIRSGWRTIFLILELAATQEQQEVASLAFGLLESLLADKFEMIRQDFVELMNCLVGFASCQHTTLSLRSIKHLIVCGNHLAEGLIDPRNEQHSASDNRDLSWESSRNEGVRRSVEGDSSVFRLWWPLLLGLSTRVADGRPSVRNEALQALKQVLEQHGHLFSTQTWAVIFKGVLFPIVDSAKSEETDSPRHNGLKGKPVHEKQSWIDSMAEQVLVFWVDCYCHHARLDTTKVIFRDVLATFNSCIETCTPNLSSIAIRVLHHMVLRIANRDPGVSAQFMPLDAEHVDIVTFQESALVDGCLHFEFVRSSNISASLPSRCSSVVATKLLRLQKGQWETVQTKYGPGKVLGVASTHSPKTKMFEVDLQWGTLYAPGDQIQFPQAPLRSGWNAIEREKLEGKFSVMKSVLHQVIGLVDETLLSLQFSLMEKHFVGLLLALEEVYWFSFLFNRGALRERMISLSTASSNASRANQASMHGFLLETELSAMQTMLKWTFALFVQHEGLLSDDSARLQRLVEVVFDRFKATSGMEFEQADDSEDDDIDSPVAVRQQDDTYAFVARHTHEAYASCMKLVLGALLEISHQQFQANRAWLLPMLSTLICANDVQIRGLLRRVYEKYVNAAMLKL